MTAVNDSRARSSSSSAFSSSALQERREPVPLGVPAVLGGRRQLLLEHGRRAADRGHLGRGDLREHLTARAPRLGERAVRAADSTSRSFTSRASASCRTVSTASISRRTSSRARASRSYVVVSGRPPPGAELPCAGTPEGQRVGHHVARAAWSACG